MTKYSFETVKNFDSLQLYVYAEDGQVLNEELFFYKDIEEEYREYLLNHANNRKEFYPEDVCDYNQWFLVWLDMQESKLLDEVDSKAELSEVKV